MAGPNQQYGDLMFQDKEKALEPYNAISETNLGDETKVKLNALEQVFHLSRLLSKERK